MADENNMVAESDLPPLSLLCLCLCLCLRLCSRFPVRSASGTGIGIDIGMGSGTECNSIIEMRPQKRLHRLVRAEREVVERLAARELVVPGANRHVHLLGLLPPVLVRVRVHGAHVRGVRVRGPLRRAPGRPGLALSGAKVLLAEQRRDVQRRAGEQWVQRVRRRCVRRERPSRSLALSRGDELQGGGMRAFEVRCIYTVYRYA